MTITLIAAVDKSMGIGVKNDLLIKLPKDLKRFKDLTQGHYCVMGRKTFQSIGKGLPKRYNIVLSRDTKLDLGNDIYIYNSVSDIIREYHEYAEDNVELFIIGGGKVYSEFLPHADRILLTKIDHSFSDVDTYFPEFDLSEWKLTSTIRNWSDEKHEYDFQYLTYERIK